MKTFISAVLFAVCASNAAIADQRAFVNQAALSRPQGKTVLASRLLTFNMDRREDGFSQAQGSVVIDPQSREITLRVDLAPFCPPGRFCAQVLRQMIVNLPLVNMERDNCGTVTYTATKDLRPVDGALQTITVSDNTRNRCPHVVAMNATDIVLRVVGARMSFNEERISTFTGTPLTRTLVAIPFDGPLMNAQPLSR